jgi:hypothetical protein
MSKRDSPVLECPSGVGNGKPSPTKLYPASGMAKLVRRLRNPAKLPEIFTLDACRHGGMTELEEAEEGTNVQNDQQDGIQNNPGARYRDAK